MIWRRPVLVHRYLPSAGPAVAVASVVSLLAATGALDPAVRAGRAAFTETGGALSVGLLIVVAAQSASAGSRIRRRAPVLVPGLLWRTGVRIVLQTGLATLLALPALVAGWEAGAARSDIVAIAAGLPFVVAFGLIVGTSLSLFGLSAVTSAVLTICCAAVALWPSTLGWSDEWSSGFPGAESPILLLAGALLTISAMTAAQLRHRRGRDA